MPSLNWMLEGRLRTSPRLGTAGRKKLLLLGVWRHDETKQPLVLKMEACDGGE